MGVSLPVASMEGNPARLSRELSVALAGAVAISAFVALTLTPMMSSKLVRPHSEEKSNFINRWVNARLERVATRYRNVLSRTTDRPPMQVAV